MSKKTEEIRKRIENAEKRKGEPLTKAQKRNIEKNVIRKYRRRNFFRAFLVTIGIAGFGGGFAAGRLTAPQAENETKIENEQQPNRGEEEETIEYGTTKVTIPKTSEPEQTNEDENQLTDDEILADFLTKYNEEFETNIEKEDLKFLMSNPQFVGVTEDGSYVYDYKQQSPEVTENKHPKIGTTIGTIYSVISNDEIISSIGVIDGEIADIDTKVAMNGERKEYFKSENYYNLLEGKTEKEKSQIFDAIGREFQKAVQSKDSNQQENRGDEGR